jgi:carboxymethylenebutenolidase
MRAPASVAVLSAAALAAACAPTRRPTLGSPAPVPGAAEAAAALRASPRHGEWIRLATEEGDSLQAWVVYPERRQPAPVVVVVHEIFGLTDWIRSVADALAAAGYLAIAPDLLSGTPGSRPFAEPDPEAARAAIRSLDPARVHRRLRAAATYAMSLPAAQPRYAVLGFCWGGSTAFAHPAFAPDVRAAVVFYGSAPDSATLARIRVPLLVLLGENDARVNATIPPAEARLRAAGVPIEVRTYPGAGHGFLRAQATPANRAAAQRAWPAALAWLRRTLGP